ncbi:MAG TPA: carboxyl transferase domain-containing protein, partial [Candidatus Dormibacteraeota bacterium]|nr:carboxyl transferase domain-containing protein [Candidatus Dormibacteraeota bacterium]
MSSPPPKHIDPLNELRQRKYEAGHGDAEGFNRQHAKGKLSSRERIARLVDRNSFEEIDLFARHRGGVPGDGVVTGMGKIDGRDVMLRIVPCPARTLTEDWNTRRTPCLDR